jgi:hypothetical protein
MVLQPFVGPWTLLQFRNHFSQSVGLLERGISPSQGRYLDTGQHKHRTNAHTNIHALSGICAHDPSAPAGEDGSCFRPRGHRDRLLKHVEANVLFTPIKLVTLDCLYCLHPVIYRRCY